MTQQKFFNIVKPRSSKAFELFNNMLKAKNMFFDKLTEQFIFPVYPTPCGYPYVLPELFRYMIVIFQSFLSITVYAHYPKDSMLIDKGTFEIDNFPNAKEQAFLKAFELLEERIGKEQNNGNVIN